MATTKKDKKVEKEKPDIEDTELGRGAIVGRALVLAVGVFFFSVTLFVAIVIVLAKFANKIGPGGAS